MNPSSSTSDPFAFLVAAGPVAALTTATAWVAALLEAEAALAHATASPAAAAIAAACDVANFDVDAIVAEAALGGNLLIPLLPPLRELAGPDVHRSATSQDMIDAATALVVRRCAVAVGGDPPTVAGAGGALGERQRGTPQ